MNAIDRLIAVADNEVGYLEKKSNKDLDDKIANAGGNNYTKYNRDVKLLTGACGLNDQWCQVFVCWCFIVAFGLDAAKSLIHTITNYTPTGSGSFKKCGQYTKRGAGKPKRGDVIYFYSSSKGRIGHVGIVYKVTDSKVYTIEGNTSGASSLVTNGGGVRRKSYSLTSTYIDGYGSPDYSVLAGQSFDAPAAGILSVFSLGDRELKNYTEGSDVKELQETLISLGFDCGSYGADGEFGDCTEMAVKAFQTASGLDATGKYDSATHAALTAAVAAQGGEATPDKARFVEIAHGKRCYVRTAPSTDGNILGVVGDGDRLIYQGQTAENGWHLVEYRGQNAWVSGKYSRLVEG